MEAYDSRKWWIIWRKARLVEHMDDEETAAVHTSLGNSITTIAVKRSNAAANVP